MVKTKKINLTSQVQPPKLILPFLLLTLAISWSIWWTIVLVNQAGHLSYGTVPMIMIHSIAILSPAISASILLTRSKLYTRKKLLKTIFFVQQPLFLYMLVVAIVFFSYLIPLALNKTVIVAPLCLSFLLLPFNLIGGGLEEVGWRFLLQPALEKKLSFFFASMVTAIIWSIWHLPIFFIQGTNQSEWNFGVFTVLALGISFILASIYRIINNIFLCILFHTLWNSIGETIVITMDIVTVLPITTALILLSYVLLYLKKRSVLANTF